MLRAATVSHLNKSLENNAIHGAAAPKNATAHPQDALHSRLAPWSCDRILQEPEPASRSALAPHQKSSLSAGMAIPDVAMTPIQQQHAPTALKKLIPPKLRLPRAESSLTGTPVHTGPLSQPASPRPSYDISAAPNRPFTLPLGERFKTDANALYEFAGAGVGPDGNFELRMFAAHRSAPEIIRIPPHAAVEFSCYRNKPVVVLATPESRQVYLAFDEATGSWETCALSSSVAAHDTSGRTSHRDLSPFGDDCSVSSCDSFSAASSDTGLSMDIDVEVDDDNSLRHYRSDGTQSIFPSTAILLAADDGTLRQCAAGAVALFDGTALQLIAGQTTLFFQRSFDNDPELWVAGLQGRMREALPARHGLRCTSPLRDFSHHHCQGAGFELGLCEARGRRKTMEDAACYGGLGGGWFTGVFDGHGGSGAARLAADQLRPLLHKHLAAKQTQADIRHALANVVADLHAAVAPLKEHCGTTANILLATADGDLYSANVGDSRAVFFPSSPQPGGATSKPVCLSTDHTPAEQTERRRLIALGLDRTPDGIDLMTTNRLRHIDYPGALSLGVSRALGDTLWETSGLSHEAAIGRFSLPTDVGGVVVSASDGLWQWVSERDVAQLLAVQGERGPAELATVLAELAYRRGGDDNLTVVVIKLGNKQGSSTPAAATERSGISA